MREISYFIFFFWSKIKKRILFVLFGYWIYSILTPSRTLHSIYTHKTPLVQNLLKYSQLNSNRTKLKYKTHSSFPTTTFFGIFLMETFSFSLFFPSKANQSFSRSYSVFVEEHIKARKIIVLLFYGFGVARETTSFSDRNIKITSHLPQWALTLIFVDERE